MRLGGRSHKTTPGRLISVRPGTHPSLAFVEHQVSSASTSSPTLPHISLFFSVVCFPGGKRPSTNLAAIHAKCREFSLMFTRAEESQGDVRHMNDQKHLEGVYHTPQPHTLDLQPGSQRDYRFYILVEGNRRLVKT